MRLGIGIWKWSKRNINQASDLKRLKKELKEVIQNATRQKNLRDERKRKLKGRNEATHKKLTGKATSDLDRPENGN